MYILSKKHDQVQQNKTRMLKQIRFLKIILFLLFNVAFGQNASLSVNEVLEKSQAYFNDTPNFSLDLNYKMFGNYSKNVPMEKFNGRMIKSTNNMYLKINNTIFISNANNNKNATVFEDEKIIEIKSKNTIISNSPIQIENFIKFFKYKNLQDKGTHYLCTLTTDNITQLPYGKVELYIEKQNFILTKQVIYFLAEYPFIDENGIPNKGNPKMVVELSNFQNSISREFTELTKLSNYIVSDGKKVNPSINYKDFKISQN